MFSDGAIYLAASACQYFYIDRLETIKQILLVGMGISVFNNDDIEILTVILILSVLISNYLFCEG